MQYPYLIILLLSVGGNLHLVGRGQVHLAYDAAGASIALKTKALSQGYNSHPWGCWCPSAIVPPCRFPRLDKQ